MEEDVFGFTASVEQDDPISESPLTSDPFSESLPGDFAGTEPLDDLAGVGSDPFSENVLTADLPEGPDLGYQVDLARAGLYLVLGNARQEGWGEGPHPSHRYRYSR